MSKIDASSLDPAKTVVVATGNAHKVVEIEAILGPIMPGARFVALGELGEFPDPVEDGQTFTENALIKARAALAETGLTCAVADDSGLCVDALGGAPGIYSARWAGVHGADDANNDKLLRELADVPEGKRGAHFHSSVVLVRRAGAASADPAATENVLVGEGDVFGRIGFERRGNNGFGYDPLFLVDDFPGRTMAELSLEEKNTVSHRFHALEALAAQLR